MRSVRLLVACALMVTVLAWAGCGTGGGGTGGKIEGVNWVLKTYDSRGTAKTVPAGVSVDALFENGKVGGFSGVNTYSGQYKLSGNSLTVGQIASTLMAGPQNLMDLEQAYLADLQQVASYSSDAAGLTLFNGSGRSLLVYTQGKTSSLTGDSWDAINYFNGQSAIVSVINGTRLTAVFAEDGTLTGSAGVNEYRATYTTSGKKISIGTPTATTSATSPDPAITQQEAEYLAALQLAATYELKGSTLTLLRSDNGIAATFEKAR